jgi:hypothetical protein
MLERISPCPLSVDPHSAPPTRLIGPSLLTNQSANPSSANEPVYPSV